MSKRVIFGFQLANDVWSMVSYQYGPQMEKILSAFFASSSNGILCSGEAVCSGCIVHINLHCFSLMVRCVTVPTS